MKEEHSEDRPRGPVPPALYPAAGIVVGYFLQRFLPLPQPTSTTFTITAWVLFGLALVLLLWSLSTLRKFNTTVLPHRASHHLVTSGPFRLSRNPIYLGFLLLVLASGLATGNIWTLLTTPLIMWLLSRYAIGPEEHHLRTVFADDYRDYAAKVRRWI